MIEIPFNSWSMIRMYDNQKTCTSRNEQKGKVGQRFQLTDIEGNPLRTYKITHVIQLPLHFVAMFLYKEEGAESPGEFIEEYNRIYKKRRSNGFDPNKVVWVHFFMEV